MTKRKHTKEDQVFKELFKNSFQTSKVPSDDFNRKIMDQVMNEWVSQPNYYQPLVDKKNRWWLLPGIIAILIIGYLFDIARLGTNANEAALLNNLGSSLQSLYSWIEPIHLILIGVSLAIGILLALDRFLQKLSNI
jgi:hypothetical protein